MVAMVTMDEFYVSRGTCMDGLGDSDLLHVEEMIGVSQGIP